MYTYSVAGDIFQRTTSVITHGATKVDVFSKNHVFSLFTNTFDQSIQSSCVGQTLYKLDSNEQVKFASVPGCNVIKSIVLSELDGIVTLAVLGSTVDGNRQVEIYDVFMNSTYSQKQVIATFFAYDVATISTKDGTFLVIANTYDTSTSALEVSYTVPVTVLR